MKFHGWNDPWWDMPATRRDQRMAALTFAIVIVVSFGAALLLAALT